MPARRHGSVKNRTSSKEVETVDLINTAIMESDIRELRRLASVRGLVNSHLRKRVWPLLLGVHPSNGDYLPNPVTGPPSSRAQRDEQTIRNDVARCLHQSHVDVGDKDRTELRKNLEHLLKSVVDTDTVYYYQGLHEIAATLMLQVGERIALPLLRRLVCTHLRDCTRDSLEAVTEALQMVYAVLACADRQLATHLQESGLPPFFALSWVITWFAHNVGSAVVPRLFDLFLSSHPLMPMYLYIAAMLEVRDELLALDAMEDLHTFLVNFDVFGTNLSVDQLAMKSVKLMRMHPPARILRRIRFRFTHSCTVEAKLVNDAWWVPEQPLSKLYSSGPLQLLSDTVTGRQPLLVSAAVGAGAIALFLLGSQVNGGGNVGSF